MKKSNPFDYVGRKHSYLGFYTMFNRDSSSSKNNNAAEIDKGSDDNDEKQENDDDSDYFHDNSSSIENFDDDPVNNIQLTEDEIKRNEYLELLFSTQSDQLLNFGYQQYNIMEQIENRIKEALIKHNTTSTLPEDLKLNTDNKLYDGCKLTVNEFRNEFQKFVSENNLSDKCSTALFDLIKRLMPENNNLPSKIDNSVSAVQSQINEENTTACDSVFEIENCNCGQTIYVAEHESQATCPYCSANRYNSTTDTRYPISLMNYRSIILIIFQLLQTREFYNAVQNVKFEDSIDNCYADVMDGEVAKKHLKEMNEKFEQQKQRMNDLKPLNLLLCLQYDGAQVFHHSIRNFWPMLVTILNLPPTLRKEIGVGTFLISLFTAYSKSVSERFLFYKLLLPELEQLYEGFILEVNGQKYCIQGRLVLHCYDSRAIESVAKVHGAGAVIGCSLCRLAPGWGSKEETKQTEEIEGEDDKNSSNSSSIEHSKKKRERNSLLPSIIYAGHRRLLPLNHWLRSVGQKHQCCPKDYYDNKCDEVRKSFFDLNELQNYNLRPSQRIQPNFILKMKSICCDKQLLEASGINNGFVVFNEDSIVDLKECLYYHFCDYRPYVPYSRISNATYLEDGKKAEELNEKSKSRKRKKIDLNKNVLSVNDGSTTKSINGVKGRWAFASLPYVDITENLCYDPFHVFKNVITYYFSYILGKRSMSNKVRKFCRNTLCHPSLYNSESGAIWELSKPTAISIENEYFKSIIFPKGYSSHIRINLLFTQPGNIHGKEIINIFDWAMDFICYAIQSSSCSYPYEYLLYYCTFSKLISELSAPVIEESEIERLYNRVVEMVCLHEGMFPVSETHMVFHQLIDLPHFIRKFGPVRGWWTLPSERGISTIKRNLNKGNYLKFYQRVYTKEFIKEYLKANRRYDTKYNLYEKDYTIKQNEEEVSFSDFRTELGEFSNKHECNAFQIKQYLQFMLFELTNISVIDKELYSPLLRLHYFFLRSNQTKDFNIKFRKTEFLHFLELLSNASEQEFETILIDDSNPKTSFVNENSWNAIKDEFKMFRKDFQFIQYLFSEDYTIPIYNTAYVWGVKFRGRGDDYYEFEEPFNNKTYGMENNTIEYFPTNPKNNWKKDFSKLTKIDVSSLCMVQLPTNSSAPELCFCQINNFSKIIEPMEPLVKDVSFAIVVNRDCDFVTLRGKTKYDNLYESKLRYLPKLSIVNIKNIYPCSLAVIHMDSLKKPIKKDDKETKTYSIIFFLLQRNRSTLIAKQNINRKILTEQLNLTANSKAINQKN